MMQEPDKYIEARIRDALATDDRTNLLDSQITIAGGKVFLMGPCDSHERRFAIETVVNEVTPTGMQVVNELYVEDYEGPGPAAERI